MEEQPSLIYHRPDWLWHFLWAGQNPKPCNHLYKTFPLEQIVHVPEATILRQSWNLLTNQLLVLWQPKKWSTGKRTIVKQSRNTFLSKNLVPLSRWQKGRTQILKIILDGSIPLAEAAIVHQNKRGRRETHCFNTSNSTKSWLLNLQLAIYLEEWPRWIMSCQRDGSQSKVHRSENGFINTNMVHWRKMLGFVTIQRNDQQWKWQRTRP